MSTNELQLNTVTETVWRVGYQPEPWAWTDWVHAQDRGRFNGRWDDINGQFRTTYAGDSLLTCLIEVLAKFRVDEQLVAALSEIVEDEVDDVELISRPPRTVDYSWLNKRCFSSATLEGNFCQIAHSISVAAIRSAPPFERWVQGTKDIDTAMLKDPDERDFTRAVASWLYQQSDPTVDGVEFSSRHGDELTLWAIFERPGADEVVSSTLTDLHSDHLSPETPALREAFARLSLVWG